MSNEKTSIFCVITQGELGGAQQFVSQLAQHIDPARFRLHVVWGQESASSLARTLPAHVTYATVHHLVRDIRPMQDLMAVRELRHMIAQQRPDIVLCISSKAGFVGSRAAQGLRRALPHMKVIYRIGGWTFNDPWPTWKKRLYIAMERLSARWKDIIVVNNMHDLAQARKLAIQPRKELICIHNGIDPYRPFLARSEAQEAIFKAIPVHMRAQPFDWLVGTVANFYPAKGLANLVQAAARVSKNVRFVVIGDGQLRSSLEGEISLLGLKDRFFLVGRMTEAAQYLSALDAFILPSLKEGFPWSVLEAMAAKVPVIATRVGAIPEIIEDHKSGLIVEPGNPEKIGQAITELLNSEHLRKELPIQAHQQILTRFSLREMIAAYEKLFTV